MNKQNKRYAASENTGRRKKSGRKSNENAAKRAFPWKGVLIGAGVAIVVAAALAIILGSQPKVVHQLPKVTPPEAVEEAEAGV